MKTKFCVLTLVALAMAVPCFAGCSPKIPSTLPITSTYSSADAANNVTQIQSDGLDGGTYYNGVDNVTSYLTCNGYNGQAFADWQFSTLNSTVRKVSISFAYPIDPSVGGTAAPNPPFSAENVIAHVEDKCSQIANGSGGYNNMLQMTAGQTFQCPLIVHFYDSNGAEYRIYMGPNWEPESTYVQVTCNSVASDGCNDWFIDPMPTASGPGQAIGRLVYFTKRTSVNEGDYFSAAFPFDSALMGCAVAASYREKEARSMLLRPDSMATRRVCAIGNGNAVASSKTETETETYLSFSLTSSSTLATTWPMPR